MPIKRKLLSRVIAGYNNNLKGSINLDRTGSEITLDIQTAKAISGFVDDYAILIKYIEQTTKSLSGKREV